MNARRYLLIVTSLSVLAAGCQKGQEPAPAASQNAAPAAAASAPAPPASQPVAPATAAPAMAAVPTGAPALASQDTNWPNVVADVTEFRRKGNTLTARVRFRNQGAERVEPDFYFSQVYVMDAAAGKKYEVLKDENNVYIASLHPSYRDRWYDTLQPGQSMTVWMKFPAPPPEVKTATLQIPKIPPFEDLQIQDQ